MSERWLGDTKINGKVIFVSNSEDPDNWFDTTWDDDIFKIDTSDLGNKWFMDPNFNNDTKLITFEKIPPEVITLIHKGTGEDLF